MAKTVAEAEAALKEIYQHHHAVADAKMKLAASKFTGDPKIIAAANEVLKAAEAAKAASGITDAAIERAAQDVLDARGEGHTETGILPPHHGINTVRASNAHAEALRLHHLGEADRGTVIAAAESVDMAIAADDATKLQHATDRHAETAVTLKGD